MEGRGGFIGLGNLGSQMVRRALADGQDIAIHDIRRTAAHEELIDLGARWYPTASTLAAESDIVLSCLPSSEIVREVFLGDGGLLSRALPGQVFVDHGVVHPNLIVELADLADTRGADFLDCPVSGGPEGAHAGTLVAMIGGPAESIRRVSPLISSYCSEIVHVGPSGKGQELKLINQLLVGGYSAVIAEAWDAVIASGIDPASALRALSSGWGKSTLLQRNFALAAAGTVDGTGATIGAFMHGLEDLSSYINFLEIDAPVFEMVYRVFEKSVSSGRSSHDLSALTRRPKYQ